MLSYQILEVFCSSLVCELGETEPIKAGIYVYSCGSWFHRYQHKNQNEDAKLRVKDVLRLPSLPTRHQIKAKREKVRSDRPAPSRAIKRARMEKLHGDIAGMGCCLADEHTGCCDDKPEAPTQIEEVTSQRSMKAVRRCRYYVFRKRSKIRYDRFKRYTKPLPP